MTAGSPLGSKLVADDIRKALVRKSSVYHDVVFQTSDEEEVAANRMLLAIRSDFFSALFYSGFAEQNASTVKIDMRSTILEEIIEFAYTGTCHLITKLKRFADKTRDIRQLRRSHFDDLVDLIRAADYCQMTPLKEAGSSVLERVTKLAPWTKCALLQLRVSEPSTVGFASRRSLHRDIARDPRASFLVPECVGRNKKDDKGNNNDFGVLDVAGPTLFELLRTSQERWDFDNEYWFQAIHYWATEGNTLPRRKHQDAEKRAKYEGRLKWAMAKRMTEQLSLCDMRPLFVKEYVEDSGLAGRDELYKAYRYHATSDRDPLRPRKKRKTGWHVDDGAKPKWKEYSSSEDDSESSGSSDSSSSSDDDFW